MNRAVRSLVAACTAIAAVAFPRAALAKGCTEVSDIVGYEKCHRFGDGWSTDRRLPISLALDLSYMQFDPNGISFTGGHSKGDQSLVFPGSSLKVQTLDAFGIGFRVEGYFLGPVYAGFGWSFAFGGNQYANVVSGLNTYTASTSLVNTLGFEGGVHLGVRVPLGRLSVRGEVDFGGEEMSVQSNGPAGGYSASAGRWMIEPRALVDIWVSPRATLTAYGGVNALHTDDRTAGVFIEFHDRSYDGAFAFW